VQRCPKALLRQNASAIRVTNRKRFAESEDSRPARRPCRYGQPGGCAVRALVRSGGVRCCRSNERCGPPKRSVTSQAMALHVHPEGRSRILWRCGLLSEESWSFVERTSVRFANEVRAKPKFAQPEVRPTPADRTGQSSVTNRRDNRQHICAGAPRCS
jgi:hypothetical protein